MASDQHALLQLLTQLQGGGSPPTSPVSGIGGGTPLSGLPLGEQGMGLGGGESLLGGSPGAGGGAEGPGLDLLTLLNSLTQGTGTIGAPSQGLLAGIGGGTESGLGAGGFLLPQRGGVPQGTIGAAGVGGGQSAATVLALLKEGLGLSKILLGQSPTASPTGGSGGTAGSGGLPNIPSALLGEGLGQSPFFGGELTPSDLSLLTGTQPFGGTGLTPGELSQLTGTTPPNLLEGIGTPRNLLSIGGGLPGFPAGAVGLPGPGGGTFSAAGNILPGLPSFGPGGTTSGAELAAQFGAQGGGEFGLANLAGGGAGLPSLGNVLPGLGVLSNVGSGILGLTQGNIAGGAGTLGGTAAGLGLGAVLAPETLGLSLLLGGLGGSAGGLLGSLFGGFGHPSVFEARRKNVGPTAQAGERALAGALAQGIQSPNALLAALGVPTPDTFGGPRNPVAVDLRVPSGTTIPGLTGGFDVPGQFTQFSFNPNRAIPGHPESVLSLQGLSAYLDYVKQRPGALDFLIGSGDVAFQSQAASEALAARVQADAQNAIRRFLGLGVPAPQPPPVPLLSPVETTSSPPPTSFLDPALFNDAGVSRFLDAGGGS